jgi:hypothetical protein
MSSPQSASVSAPRQTRQRAAPVRYREQTLENDLAPPKKKTRKSWIAKFDEELIRLNNLRLPKLLKLYNVNIVLILN